MKAGSGTKIVTVTRKTSKGHVTDVIIDGVVVSSVPTDKSQVREKRTSLLWEPGCNPEYTRVV